MKRIRQVVQLVQREWWPLLILAAVTVLFFAPVIFGRNWLPRGGGDNVSFLYPMYRFIAASLRSGELPLWNPHQYAGHYLLGDNQAGAFYPFNSLLFLLWPNFSYGALQGLVMWHIFWAGVGMYGCLRIWLGGWRLPALVGAVSFMFSDLFIVHLGNYNLIAVISWLPWCVAALWLALRREQVAWGWGVGTGALLGVSTLAGHGQMSFFIAVMLGLIGCADALKRRRWQSLAVVALLGGVAFGVSALSLLPAVAWQQVSGRADFSYAQSVNYSLPWRGLLGWVVPNFFGRNAATFWADWDRVEYGYMGIMPLLLVAAAWLLPTERRRFRLFFTLAGLFFVALALGGNAPVHALVFRPLPLPFQVPARFVVLANFCFALVAAQGAMQLMQAKRLPLAVWAGGGFALLVAVVLGLLGYAWRDAVPDPQGVRAIAAFLLLYLAGWGVVWLRQKGHLDPIRFGSLAVALVVVDVVGLGFSAEIDPHDPTVGFQHRAAIATLQADVGIDRIDVATGAWQPSTAQMIGEYDVGGVFNPLTLATQQAFVGALGYRGSPAYNFLGIKYVVADKTEPPSDTDFIIPIANDDPAVDIYLNNRALPRVQMIYQTQLVADHAAAFEAVVAADFDPSRRVVLEAGRQLADEPQPHALQLIDYRNNRVRVDVVTERDGYLVLSDAYYSGWRATVDGEPTDILRANYGYRAVYVPAGNHEVVMRFRPQSWTLGLAVSTVTWFGLLIFFARGQRDSTD